MKEISNQQWMTSLEGQVEVHLSDAIRIFQNMEESTLNFPSTSGGWSITECLWHLNSYGNYYLPLIEKSVEHAETLKSLGTFKSGRLGNYFTNMMKPGSAKKMKAFKNHIPPRDLNAHEVVAEFIRQQEFLLKLIRIAATKDLNRIKIPISIARFIRLKLGDVIQFIVAHDERHIQQAKKNITS